MIFDSVPEFPSTRPIAMEDRRSVEELFGQFPAGLSERTFGSIITWRHYGRRGDLSLMDDHLIISWYKHSHGKVMLPPVGPDPSSVLVEMAESGTYNRQEFKGCYGLLEPVVTDLRSRGRTCEPLRDEWDYVYRTEDLAGLQGPKYHTQRKELKKATSNLELVFEPMTKDHQKACLQLEETWCDLKHCTFDKLSQAEDFALREAIANLDELGYIGGVVLANGKLEALTVGEKLSEDTAVVHFEKANPAIRGLYQFVNQQFCERSLRRFEFVNREQDVGEPGLRRAKEGYHPHHFVEKHIMMFG